MAPNPATAFRPEPSTIPDAPGSYQFKDADARVIYVGKAKSLRSRVSSYFGAWHNIQPRTRAMLRAARAVEWIVVDNEVDALHLEYTLIQRHRPRYNVRYRDDKSYPHLVLTTSKDVPRARVARGRVAKGDRKFGPYAHAYAIRETLDLLTRLFPVRTCSKGVYERAERSGRPCLLADIGKCAAPCVGRISHDDHRALVDELGDFLDGTTTDEVLARLETEMDQAAASLNFESAARLRDQLRDARRVLARQQMVSDKGDDFDVVAVHGDELEAAVQAFFVRNGRVTGRKGWIVDKVEDLSPSELMTSFLLQLYSERSDDVPPRLYVDCEPDDAEALSNLLADLRNEATAGSRGRPTTSVGFTVPRRGDKVDLVKTVADNARQAFQRHRLKRASDFTTRSAALRELQEALGLVDAPLRIECYDISHLGGTEVVASMVVFEDGLARKDAYRRFKLSQDRNDDFAAMEEVIRRRFQRLVDERHDPDADPEKFSYPPGLVIVDGGRGQLTAALEGFGAVEVDTDDDETAEVLDGVDFAALAKKFEELHRPGRARPVVLPRGSDALYLVQQVRDEAHRFAVTYQRTRRRRSITTSELEEIEGIGPTRRRALLRRFGSTKAISEASATELSGVPGVSATLADRIKDQLKA
ncbi:excinuclease ABC subunit UvrC [Salsipaludibacter albus]|uniref:excinuclease ABC subunit UvrC n=1 Tax=Salsipaludibacter albus TaxID=2849650 RepID=UPI001EE3A9AC|nr:excinuclease ABC subunit UvrC [Salsipaludibacter albus]MBY5161698.1 excinuclease ABC subunit UvrC [Salsipaludibacter albus]